MVSPVTPPSSDSSDPTFKVERADAITLGFEKAGGKKEGSIGFEEVISEISDTDENLMGILEAALKKEGIDPQQDTDKIKSVKGHFEKEEGNIVAEIYTKEEYELSGERAFWKFKMTWIIEVEGGPPIKRTVWIKTPITIPEDMSDVKEYEHSKHRALLYVKALRHVHKAALDPKHADYAEVVKKIEFLRSHNQIEMAFKTSAWVESTEALDRAFVGNFRIRKGEYTQWAEIKLKDDVPNKTLIERIVKMFKGSEYFSIDYIRKGREKGDKYGGHGIGTKYMQQASEIVVKDKRLQEFEELSKASKTDFLGKFKNYVNKCNSSSQLYGRIDAALYVMRANNEVKERREKLKTIDKALRAYNLPDSVASLRKAMENYQDAVKEGSDTAALKEDIRQKHKEINSVMKALDDMKEMREFIALKKEQADELVEHYEEIKSSDKAAEDKKGTLQALRANIGSHNEDAEKELSKSTYQPDAAGLDEVKKVLAAAKSIIDAPASST